MLAQPTLQGCGFVNYTARTTVEHVHCLQAEPDPETLAEAPTLLILTIVSKLGMLKSAL